MKGRYSLSDDQVMKVRTILEEETKKAQEVLKDQSLSPEARMNNLQSLKQEEVSQVSSVLTSEQKQKYEADTRFIPTGHFTEPGAAPGSPNI